MTAETDLIQQLRAKVIAFQEGTHLRPKPSAAARAEMRGIQGTLAVVLAEIDAALQQRDERLATVEHEREALRGALEDITTADSTSTLEGAVALAKAVLEATPPDRGGNNPSRDFGHGLPQ